MAKVAVAMSGGVDSSVAAYLLNKQGHEVIGVTMKLVEGQDEEGTCCSWKTINRAKSTCYKLGIPHYVFNFSQQFEDTVIRDFTDNYRKAMTPNPCLRCNQHIKFDALLNKMRACGMDYIATGHYAIVEEGNNRRMCLRRGVDKRKNQSYTLYETTQDQLRHTLFPLGEYTKEEIREIAKKNGLPSASASDSMGICFIPGDYREFLQSSINPNPGDIYFAEEDRVVARHNGLHNYTVGQRAGLSCLGQLRVYITHLDFENNRVVIGRREDIPTRECSLYNLNWVSHEPLRVGEKIEGMAEVGYGAKPYPATMQILENDRAEVTFSHNSRCLNPGQSLVLYEEDTVLVGGIIEKSWN
jgi:tRNA-uridine 2-sulfurtransferase